MKLNAFTLSRKLAQVRADMGYKNDFDWSRECEYISHVTDKVLHTDRAEQHPVMAKFNHDRACFIRYCEMQRDSATRDGKDDAATYIQHCLDDLTEGAT